MNDVVAMVQAALTGARPQPMKAVYEAEPGTWVVEVIDMADDGACHVTLFFGPDAEARARAYAA